MAPDNAQAEFINRLRVRGFELSAVSIDVGFSEAFAFYRDVRPVGCDEDLDGDMLLFQWGTYDLGEGRYFNLNLTRQFILEGTEGDEGIFQLGFTFLYTPSPTLEVLRDGNRWCSSPAGLPEFQRYVTSSEAYRVAAGQVPAKVRLTYEAC
jgi:hypothetical protein